MAIAKSARVLSAELIGPDTRLVRVRAQEPLGFAGGQYIIVDSGLRRADGKAVKRAYSLLSADREQSELEIAIKQLPGGAGSRFMHELEPGAELRFSGPWGKLLPDPAARGGVFVLATDTGISAALGLVRGARMAELLSDTTLIWLRTSSDYFAPDAWVRERVPPACCELRIAALPPIDHPERIPVALARLRERLARGPLRQVFFAGDGAINYALLDAATAAGIAATRDHVESFFNMPKKA